jgi:large subunit ribosomal protein L9
VQVTLTRRVGENDKLFGSVTATDIMDGLKKQGHSVEKRMIELTQPIKTLGVHTVNVNFDTDISTTVKVWVVKEEE